MSRDNLPRSAGASPRSAAWRKARRRWKACSRRGRRRSRRARSRAELDPQLVTLDPALADTERLLDESAIACREAVAGLRRYADGLEADPAPPGMGRITPRCPRVRSAQTPLRHRAVAGPAGATRQRAGRRCTRAQLDLAELERRLAQRATSGTGRQGRSATDAAPRRNHSMRASCAECRASDMPGGVFVTRVEPRAAGEVNEHARTRSSSW